MTREKRHLQRLDHYFVVSYLGFAHLEENRSKFALYLEYCDGGDLETMHVKRLPQSPKSPSREEEELLTLDGLEFSVLMDLSKPAATPADSNETRCVALNESDAWTLMY
jgi:hypothetical protein